MYFPLLVLLRKNGKNWEIDKRAVENVVRHQELMKKVYVYHNKPARFVYEQLFE